MWEVQIDGGVAGEYDSLAEAIAKAKWIKADPDYDGYSAIEIYDPNGNQVDYSEQ